MDTRLVKRTISPSIQQNNQLIFCSIIQDCEDALTNWVESNAAVRSKLSVRARTLSQRRRNKNHEGGVDLAQQDQPLKGDRDSWVNANQHEVEYEDEEEEDEEEEAAGNEVRGRDAVAA